MEPSRAKTAVHPREVAAYDRPRTVQVDTLYNQIYSQHGSAMPGCSHLHEEITIMEGESIRSEAAHLYIQMCMVLPYSQGAGERGTVPCRQEEALLATQRMRNIKVICN